MRIGIILLCLLSLSFGQLTRTHKLNWATDTILVDSISARKIKVSNTPKPISTDSVLTKHPDGTIGTWPIALISSDTTYADSARYADSSRASYKADTAEGALRLGGKTLSQIDTIGHGAIKQSIRDTASNKLWIHGKADSSVLADSVKKIPPVAFSDSSRAAYKADTSAGALRLGGKTKVYYDTVGAGWIRDSLANKLCLHCVADSAAGAARLGGKTLSQIDTIGHGAIKKSIRDTASNKLWVHGKADSSVLADSVKKNLAISKITGLSDSLANKLPLHGVADSAKGARYLGGKTKTYYDTVGHGAINTAIASKENSLGTSTASKFLNGIKQWASITWSAITGKPTTISGYGITDAYTKTQVNDSLATKVPTSRTITAGTGLSGGGSLSANRTINVSFGTAANTVCQGNDPRLSDAREPINHGSYTSSYYVQGTTNNRSTDYHAANPIDEMVYSTFFRLNDNDPSSPNDGFAYFGLRAAHPTDSIYTTEIIGRIGRNKLLWGGWDGTRRDWLEIYHSGNLNPDYYVQGSSSTRTTEAGSTDVNSYTQSGFYRSASTAPNTPIGVGCGIIHTNYTSNQRAFQLASRWNSNKLFYRTKYNDTWAPWVELWHTGNLNPADYQSAITGTGNKVLSIQADGTGVKTGSIYDDGNVALIGKTTATGGYKFEVEGNTRVNGDLLSNAITANGYLNLRNKIRLLNKVGNGWIDFLTRNTSGTEVAADLNNVRSINPAGNVLSINGNRVNMSRRNVGELDTIKILQGLVTTYIDGNDYPGKSFFTIDNQSGDAAYIMFINFQEGDEIFITKTNIVGGPMQMVYIRYDIKLDVPSGYAWTGDELISSFSGFHLICRGSTTAQGITANVFTRF